MLSGAEIKNQKGFFFHRTKDLYCHYADNTELKKLARGRSRSFPAYLGPLASDITVTLESEYLLREQEVFLFFFIC
jgi:hypothetical protein